LDLAVYVGDARRQEAIRTIFANSLRRLGNLYTPVERVLSTTRVPALVGWGDRDPFFPVEVGRRTAALLPGSRFRVYEDAGHFLPEERPQAIAEDLRELASHLRPR
jgi:pimeloyl-ACP methyl ester carboxylesterase